MMKKKINGTTESILKLEPQWLKDEIEFKKKNHSLKNIWGKKNENEPSFFLEPVSGKKINAIIGRLNKYVGKKIKSVQVF